MAGRKSDTNETDPKSQNTEPETRNETEDFTPRKAEWLELTEKTDFMQFLAIARATGEILDETLDDPTESTRQEIIGRFHAWVQAGKPKPQLNIKAGAPEQILAVYRLKWYGKQKLAWKINGKEVLGGMRSEPQYRKMTDQHGNQIDDKNTVIGHKVDYIQDYNKEIATKIVERCMREAPEPKLYFKLGSYTVSVKDPANFFGDFDALMMKARKDII